jgi:hypothetical protein
LAYLQQLRGLLTGELSSWGEFIDYLNLHYSAPCEARISDEMDASMNTLCIFAHWERQHPFTLHGINSPAVLLHWRVLVGGMLLVPVIM